MPVRQFVAIAVADVDNLAAWYAHALDLIAGDAFDAADGSRVIALRGPDLMIELKQRAQHVERREFADGYFKTGWFVPDLHTAHARLVAAGASVVVDVTDQPDQGVRFSIAADPEGNLIQLFEDIPG